MATSIILSSTAKIITEFVAYNRIAPSQLPEVIQSVMGTLSSLGHEASAGDETPSEKPTPAIPIRKSVTADTITCLFCGKRGSALRKHLSAAHQMEPSQYRAYWGLPLDYPMTAPTFSARRSEIAHAIGLGTGTKRGKGTRTGN